MDETASRYRRVADPFDAIVHAVPDGAWDRPAPCAGWVARDVVLHLAEWVPAFFAAADGPTLPAAPPGADPIEAWTALDAAIRAALEDPTVASASISHPHAGTHTFAEAIDTFVREDVMLHTWDLAHAVGEEVTLDPELVHESLLKLEPMDEVLRASGHFGPKVEVPDDADEQTRLLAFVGRRP
ncbi:TIGR03086 family protein [Aquihabitans sp. G128]|uniref:TIGR03086 family metal-binding protein n=1 Tax=Aquihabitans sp. G128 TaxID=2849779 RepID=UPI001C250324|nr:TIGR03086 family metal-binding protein [Aquihabitans sp. G128]QXC62235.1 TIGR03086 family protein [Aquihabitans sp. G128]